MQKEYTMRRRLTSRRFTEDDERHFAKMTPAQRRIEVPLNPIAIINIWPNAQLRKRSKS